MAEDLNDDWWEETPALKKPRKEPSAAASSAKAKKKTAPPAAAPESSPSSSSSESESEAEEPAVQKASKRPAAAAAAAAPQGKQKKPGRKQFDNPVLSNRAKLGSNEDAASILWGEIEKAFGTDVSAVEMDEIRFDASHMAQVQMEYTGDWTLIGDFLRKALPEGPALLQADKGLKLRHPRVLIITSSATRGCDFVRGLRGIRGSMVGRFFAKHMKFVQQTQFMDQHKFAVAVGTPGRLAKLHAEGGLRFDELRLVVLDYSFVDVKNRNVFQIPEVQQDLAKLLRASLLPHCVGGSLRLALF